MNPLKVNQKIFFEGEKLPYNVMAVSERYAVVSRKLHRREDAYLLHHTVDMGAYLSFTQAYNELKDDPVYSLLDFKKWMRGASNLIFDDFNYFLKKDCEKVIKRLENGKMELSKRNSVPLKIQSI